MTKQRYPDSQRGGGYGALVKDIQAAATDRHVAGITTRQPNIGPITMEQIYDESTVLKIRRHHPTRTGLIGTKAELNEK